VELGRKSLKVTVLSEVLLALVEGTLALGLRINLGRTQRIPLRHEIILIDSF